jgi:AbrB family looped-hinge helix DNA binding protein
MERFRVEVHHKGLIVIPASVRKCFGILEGSYVEMVVEGDTIRIIVPGSLRDYFGVDGEKAVRVAELISESRRREAEEEASS